MKHARRAARPSNSPPSRRENGNVTLPRRDVQLLRSAIETIRDRAGRAAVNRRDRRDATVRCSADCDRNSLGRATTTGQRRLCAEPRRLGRPAGQHDAGLSRAVVLAGTGGAGGFARAGIADLLGAATSPGGDEKHPPPLRGTRCGRRSKRWTRRRGRATRARSSWRRGMRCSFNSARDGAWRRRQSPSGKSGGAIRPWPRQWHRFSPRPTRCFTPAVRARIWTWRIGSAWRANACTCKRLDHDVPFKERSDR